VRASRHYGFCRRLFWWEAKLHVLSDKAKLDAKHCSRNFWRLQNMFCLWLYESGLRVYYSAHNWKYGTTYHSGNVSSSSVNGDIAFLWEWSNFNHSQNPNPLTDYDKTLHNWLCPRDEHVTQNLCQSTLRERLAKYVKDKASLFYFLYIFFPGLAYWSNPCMEFHARCVKTRVVT